MEGDDPILRYDNHHGATNVIPEPIGKRSNFRESRRCCNSSSANYRITFPRNYDHEHAAHHDRTDAGVFDAALEDVRRLEAGDSMDDKYVLSLPDEEALERVLHAKNLELVRTIATQEPESVCELARLVDRDIKNVSTALNRLAELSLVELEDSGRAKKPTVWYDHVEIDIQITPDDSDVVPA